MCLSICDAHVAEGIAKERADFASDTSVKGFILKPSPSYYKCYVCQEPATLWIEPARPTLSVYFG